ncbi:MAG: GTPase domain-containing protein [Acidobacteriota bacterium]
MAHLDPDTGRLCLHVVYDGAPRSGKTTTIRALARRHGLQVETPEERDGRTLYFDWLDLQGGQVLGRPIQCRTVAVPGQDGLAARRAAILEAADAVIFIVDSGRQHVAASRQHFEELLTILGARTRPIPVLTQLNKRDADDAMELDGLRPLFEDHSIHLLESVATDGEGIQETFALGVSEAVRALHAGSLLKPGGPSTPSLGELDLRNPHSLLERLLAQEKTLPGRKESQ